MDSGIIDDGMQVQRMSQASVSFVTSNVYLPVFKEPAIDNVETSLTMPYARTVCAIKMRPNDFDYCFYISLNHLRMVLSVLPLRLGFKLTTSSNRISQSCIKT